MAAADAGTSQNPAQQANSKGLDLKLLGGLSLAAFDPVRAESLLA